MQVLLNTDAYIDGREDMAEHLESVVTTALGHHASQITCIEAHLSDENGARKPGPSDIHCTLEARPVGLHPVVARDRASTVYRAMHSALRKLERILTKEFEKQGTGPISVGPMGKHHISATAHGHLGS